MKISFLLLIASSMPVASCRKSPNNNKFICLIKANHAAGLQLATPVRANGFQIGQIGQLTVNPAGDMVATIEMADTFRLSRKATLELYQPTLLGEAAIRVRNFAGPPYLTPRDTVVLAHVEPAFQQPDSITVGHIRAALQHVDSALRRSVSAGVDN